MERSFCMFFDMTKEQREEFTEKLHIQLNYGRLKNGERTLKKLYAILFVLIGVGIAFIILSFVDVLLTFLLLLLPFIVGIGIAIGKSMKISKNALNVLIKELSENQLDYTEYKKFKKYFIKGNNNG